MKNSTLFSALFFLLITSATFGQANFTGSWAFNESKSNLGQSQFRMYSPVLTVNQDANTFSIERTFKNQNGDEMKSNEKYTLDGKESVNPVFNTSKKSTATWSADKNTLTVSSTMVFEFNGESNEIKTVENYKLSDAGKVMTIDTKSTSSRGERVTSLVYDKK